MIAGVMAIGPSHKGRINPRWPYCLTSMLHFADVACVRIDALSGTPEKLEELKQYVQHLGGSHIAKCWVSNEKWNRWNWREELLRSLDDIMPDIVLQPDCDEMFEPLLWEDIATLEGKAGLLGLMFDYVMVARDGVRLKKYPRRTHLKAYRWAPRLTFVPYCGYGRPRAYRSRQFRRQAISRIYHFSHFTAEDRDGRPRRK